MPKIATVPLTPRGQKQNQVVWSQVQEGGGCQGEDTHAELLSLFILARLLKEFLHRAKAEVFFNFSLGFLLASGLQENGFLIFKLFQGKFCKWDLMATVPNTSASFLPQHKKNSVQPTPTGSSQLKKKQEKWHHSFTLLQFSVPAAAQVPGSRCCLHSSPDPVPSVIVDGAASARRDVLLDGVEQMDQGELDCLWTPLVSFCFVLVPCWLFGGRGVCLS